MASYLFRSVSHLLKVNPIQKTELVLNQSKLFQRCYTTTTSEPIVETVKDEDQIPKEAADASAKFLDKKEALKFHPFGIAKANPVYGFEGNMLGWQPTSDTHSALMIEGVPYNKTHLVSIKSSRNNTILSLSESNGNILYTTSAGTCGFKNSKKSTAVAGQGAGLALSEYAKRRGIKNVRVAVKGFGNGRLASIKSLQMGKLNIISITDNTPIPMPFSKPPRPPAKRRV